MKRPLVWLAAPALLSACSASPVALTREAPAPLFAQALSPASPEPLVTPIELDDEAPVHPLSLVATPAVTSMGVMEFVEATPSTEPAKFPQVSIRAPLKNQVIPTAKVEKFAIKLGVLNWPLSQDGNHVQLVLDNKLVRGVFDLKQTVTLGELAPDGLSEGQHILAALPVRPNGESVKPKGKKVPASVVSFFVGQKGEVRWKDGTPLLVYNAPLSGPAVNGAMLLDFYVFNAEISDGRYVVHAAVSGPGIAKGESITSWRPWQVTNPRTGTYRVRLELFKYGAELTDSSSTTTVTYRSSKVAGMFVEALRDVRIEPPAEQP